MVEVALEQPAVTSLGSGLAVHNDTTTVHLESLTDPIVGATNSTQVLGS